MGDPLGRGHLLVPAQRALWTSRADQSSATAIPGVPMSPKWPYESWSIDQFNFSYNFNTSYEIFGPEKKTGEISLEIAIQLDHETVWSAKAEKEVESLSELPNEYYLIGSFSANLTSPILIQGGQQMSFLATFAVTVSESTERGNELVIPAFRIPFAVEGR